MVQGLASSEKRMSGSTENLFPPNESKKIAAGRFSEKLGTREIPLFVIVADPEKWYPVFELSTICADAETEPVQLSKIHNQCFMCIKTIFVTSSSPPPLLPYLHRKWGGCWCASFANGEKGLTIDLSLLGFTVAFAPDGDFAQGVLDTLKIFG